MDSARSGIRAWRLNQRLRGRALLQSALRVPKLAYAVLNGQQADRTMLTAGETLMARRVHNVLAGIGSLVEWSPRDYRPLQDPSAGRTDLQALASDWRRVGDLLRWAIQRELEASASHQPKPLANPVESTGHPSNHQLHWSW